MTKKRDEFYGTGGWERLRKVVLKRDNYTCQLCGVKCLGRRRGMPSPHVDHTIPRKDAPHLAMEVSNLRTLCASCHSKRTINDMHAQGKPLIGVDGYVVEE